MAGFTGFGSQMKPLGTMWSQPQGQQQQGAPTGQLPQMQPPQQVGMVPGVPGSMGLNPGGQMMTPGGGGMGAPLQMGQMPMNGQNPGYQMPGQQSGMLPPMGGGGFGAQMQPQMQGWLQSRPDHQGFTGSPQDWRSQMQDWRGQRPQFGGGFMHPMGGG